MLRITQPSQDTNQPVLVQQQREDYRLIVPAEDEATCTFKLSDKLAPESLRLEIYDISGGGLSVLDYHQQLGSIIGSVMKSCTLHLPTHTKPALVTLKVLRAQEERLPNQHVVTRVSCQFQNLSDKDGIPIRHYVAELERQQLAQLCGLE